MPDFNLSCLFTMRADFVMYKIDNSQNFLPAQCPFQHIFLWRRLLHHPHPIQPLLENEI
jgi:hypothetical protein